MPLTEKQKAAEAVETLERRNEPCLDVAERDALVLMRRLGRGARVTSDQLIPEVGKYGFSDNRAVGAVMLRLIHGGHLVRTSHFRTSQRHGNHGCPRRVYRIA